MCVVGLVRLASRIETEDLGSVSAWSMRGRKGWWKQMRLGMLLTLVDSKQH